MFVHDKGNSMTKQNILLLTLGALAIAAIIYLSGDEASKLTAIDKPIAVVTIPDKSSALAVTNATLVPPTKPTKVSNSEEYFDDANPKHEWRKHYQEVQDWQGDNFGYYSTDRKASYKDYDIETLEAMARGGDFLAVHVLGRKYLEENNLEGARKAYYRAAVMGSTYPMAVMPNILIISDASHDMTPKGRRTNTLDELAFLQVAVLRGDKNAVSMVDSKLKLNGIELTKDERVRIQTKGLMIYNQFEEMRVKMGLGKFDNYVPSYVDSYYDYHIKNLDEYTSGDNAIFILKEPS